MRTGLMIGLILMTVALAALVMVALLVVWLGPSAGIVVSVLIAAALVAVYLLVLKPWHLRWGATDAEVERAMPGDELLPGAESATRAITIAAAPEDVWPWLVQLGYGRAGWYSYDWVDNDFKPSADRILPEYRDLRVGDTILMMPGMGFVTQSVDEPHSIVSLLGDGSTRLISRWRPRFERSVATFFMLALVEPGTFVMEQKMLRTIRDRVESSAQGVAES